MRKKRKTSFLRPLHSPSSTIRMWSEFSHKREVIFNEKVEGRQRWSRNHSGTKTQKDITLLNKYLLQVSTNYLSEIFIHMLDLLYLCSQFSFEFFLSVSYSLLHLKTFHLFFFIWYNFFPSLQSSFLKSVFFKLFYFWLLLEFFHFHF